MVKEFQFIFAVLHSLSVSRKLNIAEASTGL